MLIFICTSNKKSTSIYLKKEIIILIMKKWEEDRNRIAHSKKLKYAKPQIDSNVKITRQKKPSIIKSSKSPLCTQKYFEVDSVFQNIAGNGGGHWEIIGKNLFGFPNEAQGGGILEEKDSFVDRSYSRLNSTKDSNQK